MPALLHHQKQGYGLPDSNHEILYARQYRLF